MIKTFDSITIYLESSEINTDANGLAEAIEVAGGELISSVEAEYVDCADDDTEDDFIFSNAPGNLGQYTQPIRITFTRSVVLEELEQIMDRFDPESFGFGNGWALQ